MAEAARRQYNKLKMQTKAEIRQTIDRLLVGDFIVSFCPKNVYVGFFCHMPTSCRTSSSKEWGVFVVYLCGVLFKNVRSIVVFLLLSNNQFLWCRPVVMNGRTVFFCS